MVAYRFCRPDDMPLICRAVNECYNVHFPGLPPLTVDGLRSEIQELGVWVSNAMVAREGSEPIGVMVGTKRPREVLIHRIGVRPDFQRRGHGRHMLTSLSQKLAVLGPPRLIAEVPELRPDLLEFFAASGYRKEQPYTDFLRSPRSPLPDLPLPEELILPVGVDELGEHGLLEIPEDVAWERSRASLEGRGSALAGLAIATPEQVEAFVLARPADPPQRALDILAWGCRQPSRRPLFLGMLIRYLENRSEAPLRLPRLTAGEAAQEWIAELGFEPAAVHWRLAAVAAPA